uniref:DUF3715 domain-containing protein n=1 Tax=Syphacia muris TaxID=451379 RepID=A0A0N5AFD0_9BILA
MLSTLSQYVIPRKVAVQRNDQLKEDEFRFTEVPSTSERFREVYAPIVFEKLRDKLSDSGVSAEISYAFMIVGNNAREIDLIAKESLWTGNVAVGDLGTPRKGVYLSESPDLTTPASFIEETTSLRIFAFKVLKGKSKSVALGSYEMEPSFGYNSHVSNPPPEPSLLTRHELYRYNQIYLFELQDSVHYSTHPSNVLPFALYTVQFSSLLNNVAKKIPVVVWRGKLAIKDRVYGSLRMISPMGVAIKPFLLMPQMQIEQLIDWSDCIKSPIMVELLAVPLAGELGVRKELVLKNQQRFVSYFTLEPEESKSAFDHFFDFMRIQSLVAFVNLDGYSSLILIPEGFLSILLALPFKSGSVFHCLYVSSMSMLYGHFVPCAVSEVAEFDSDPLLGEKVDGIDVAVHRIAREIFPSEWLKHDAGGDDEDSLSPSERCPHPNATPEQHSPVEMEVDKVDESRGITQAKISVRPGETSSVEIENLAAVVPESNQKTVQVSQRAPDPRRKRHLQISKDLPLPKLSDKPIEDIKAFVEGISRSKAENEKTTVNSEISEKIAKRENEDVAVKCRISDESSADAHSEKTDIADTSTEGALVIDDDLESPASPPPENGVYVAPASKIIPVSSEQSRFDTPLEGPSKLYRAPQVSLFPDTLKDFLNSPASVKQINQLASEDQETKIESENPLEMRVSDADERKERTNLTTKVESMAPNETKSLASDTAPNNQASDDDLIRASSKDVDLRFMKVGVGPLANGALSVQRFGNLTTTESSKTVINLLTPFAGNSKDRDDRVLLSSRTKENVYGVGATRVPSYLLPSTSKANESSINELHMSKASGQSRDFTSSNQTVNCNSWNTMALDLTRPPPPIASAQRAVGYGSEKHQLPSHTLPDIHRRPPKNNTSLYPAPSSRMRQITAQPGMRTFGFFNPVGNKMPMPPPPPPFSKQPAGRGKLFFSQVYPHSNLCRPRSQGPIPRLQRSGRFPNTQVCNIIS